MRILVTGGAGFLGSHLADRLLEMGHGVVVADNFYTGSKENIAHLLNNPKFELVRHDVTFPLYVEVDGIFNLACPASPIQYQKNPVQTFKTSVHGAINMLGLAKRTGARFFKLLLRRFTEIQQFHLKPKTIGATSTQLESDHVTTKVNVQLKL